jgi:hypothetical protein
MDLIACVGRGTGIELIPPGLSPSRAAISKVHGGRRVQHFFVSVAVCVTDSNEFEPAPDLAASFWDLAAIIKAAAPSEKLTAFCTAARRVAESLVHPQRFPKIEATSRLLAAAEGNGPDHEVSIVLFDHLMFESLPEFTLPVIPYWARHWRYASAISQSVQLIEWPLQPVAACALGRSAPEQMIDARYVGAARKRPCPRSDQANPRYTDARPILSASRSQTAPCHPPASCAPARHRSKQDAPL